MVHSNSLKNTVLEGGYCVGCGTCTAAAGGQLRIAMNETGCYEAVPIGAEIDEHALSAAGMVCPFSEQAVDEDVIGRALFGDALAHDSFVGYHQAIYAGYVEEGAFRARGSSGGFGKWILYELLRQNLVDAVIQIEARTPDDKNDLVYSYSVMERAEDVLEGSRSVYYPVEMSDALAYIKENEGRYAITGIPCFIKAIRLLCRQEPLFNERIRFCVGIICGHLKSKRYADMLAWQLGVKPDQLGAIDFRMKFPGKTAKQKGVQVHSRVEGDGDSGSDIVQNLFGADYNHGFFQYKACDFCDDVVGETADISVGDAWLPAYIPDGRGTSLIIPRHPLLHSMIEQAHTEGRLHLERLTAEQAVQSQIGGFRHRREGLAYRLHLTDSAGVWRPPKRVKPSKRQISRRRRSIYRMRIALVEQSHATFKKALALRDFEVFRDKMGVMIDQYQELYRPTLIQRIRKGILRRWKRWFGPAT